MIRHGILSSRFSIFYSTRLGSVAMLANTLENGEFIMYDLYGLYGLFCILYVIGVGFEKYLMVRGAWGVGFLDGGSGGISGEVVRWLGVMR